MRAALRQLSFAAFLAIALVPPTLAQNWTFADGFESGGPCAWSVRSGSADPCTPVDHTVYELRLMATNGGPFKLQGVTITARSADGRHYWVADDALSAPLHGVFVFRGVSAAPLDPLFDAGAWADVVGFALEFDAQPPGETLTEFLWGEPVQVGIGSPPTPVVETVADIASTEQLEGVLVEFGFSTVTAAGAGDRITMSDGSGTIVLDDLAFDYAAADYPVGTCLAGVTGIAHYDTLLDERQVLPRSSSDLDVIACPP